ncbi:hypothetical protein GQ54DRAFT_64800 [Martensiomyces pterosporus]|nr:hypothetical protein GQ54DRAFT_64800 [Martensiomyces pterosporus]
MDAATAIIKRAIADASEELCRISLSIHSNPELALKELHACKVLTDYLKSQGHSVEHNVAGLETAFIATYTSPAGAEGGLTIGFCSEYDALPEIGHACGHNLIAISGVASYIAICALFKEASIPGTVRLFGTPAEEAEGGKITMHEAKVFDGTDVLLMLHPSPVSSGAWHSQCAQSVRVEYFGKPSHSAIAPWRGVNAGSAANIAMNAMGVMREQFHPTWRVHGIIEVGGKASNVVSDYARLSYGFRTQTKGELETLREKVLKVFEAGAIATGCTHKLTLENPYLDNVDNPLLGKMYEEIMEEEFESPPVHFDVGGSTDFGNLSHDFISLHANFPLKGLRVLPHTAPFAEAAKTEIAHESTLFAAETNARVAARCAIDKEFWAAVKKSHEEREMPAPPPY